MHAAGAFKAVTWLCLIAPGLTACLYARTYLTPLLAGLVGILYLAAPFHLYDVYNHGDYPEALAQALIPLTLWSLDRLFRQPAPWTVVVLAGSGAALLLTHNLTAFLSAPFLALYALIKCLRRLRSPELERRSLIRLTIALGSAPVLLALLTAVHWLPIVTDREGVQFDRLKQHLYQSHFLEIDHLISWEPAPWVLVSGAGQAGAALDIRFTLVYVIGLLLALGGLALARRRSSGLRGGLPWEIAAQSLIGVAALFLMIDASSGIWEAVPVLQLAQFPARLLAFLSLAIAFLIGAGLQGAPRSLQIAGVSGLVGLTVLTTAHLAPTQLLLAPEDLRPEGIIHFELGNGPDGGVSTGEFLPRQIERPPWASPWALSQITAWQPPPSPERPLVRAVTEPARRVYEVTGWPGGVATLDTAAFPGWAASIDGQPVAFEEPGPDGLTRLAVPTGDHQVELLFQGTAAHAWAARLSATAAGLVGPLSASYLVRRRWFSLVPRSSRHEGWATGWAIPLDRSG
jgi:hypothetical protein